jgi:ParB family chromosome partitioning protein
LGRGLESLLGGATFSDPEEFEIVQNKKTTKPQEAPIPLETKEKVETSIPERARIWQLAIEKIVPNKEQPRKVFLPEELKELAASIKEKGIIQPILVRKLEGSDQYQLIAGERRWRAAQIAGHKEVPAIIKDLDTRNVLEVALIENIQRQDLNPVEECEAYVLLARKYNLTQAEIADRVGKDRATVANVMRIAQLSPDVREMLLKNELQLGQAKLLLGVDDKKAQEELAKKIHRQGLSVRATERLVSQWKQKKSLGEGIHIVEDEVERDEKLYRSLASELQKELGTRVNIEFSGSRGRLSIDFYSDAELNKVVDKIRGAHSGNI